MTTSELVKCIIYFVVVMIGICVFTIIVTPQVVGWCAVVVFSLDKAPKIIKEIRKKK